MDDDEQLARALNESANDYYEMHKKAQEEADAEYALQLSAEFAEEQSQNPDLDNSIRGDDIDAVLEQIARVEAQERLKKTGHAYSGKTNINRIIDREEQEELAIRKEVKHQDEMRIWREERDRQDAEYADALKKDQEKEKQKLEKLSLSQPPLPQPLPQPPQPLPQPPLLQPLPQPPQPPLLQPQPPIPEIVPTIPVLNKDELRTARLAFLAKYEKK